MGEFSKNNEKKINQVFYELLRSYGISRKYEEYKLKSEWPNVVGKTIAKQTLALKIEKEILYVKLNSAALRQNLSYARFDLIEKLNASVSSDLIKDIVFH
jgi:predicted nucleic acid-binding Zn ribbon protein